LHSLITDSCAISTLGLIKRSQWQQSLQFFVQQITNSQSKQTTQNLN